MDVKSYYEARAPPVPRRAMASWREAQALAALNHPGVAHVYGLEGEPPLLVMVLVEGDDVAARVARYHHRSNDPGGTYGIAPDGTRLPHGQTGGRGGESDTCAPRCHDELASRGRATIAGPELKAASTRYDTILYMKAIQITLDEALLARLDQDEEVKRDGRSAVLRRAADLYLRQRKAREVAAAYRRAYADTPGVGAEFEGWEREGAWPVE